ncbi:hypothetical protein ABE073_02855 [Lederbergia citrisecunda]|uniref:hypothetical protein n=1 Tax=Lederbergia citrisecunda TaxID=2833583 RepID=UPI003D2DB946
MKKNMKYKSFLMFLLSVIIFSTSGFAASANSSGKFDSEDSTGKTSITYYETEEEILEAHKKLAEEELRKIMSGNGLFNHPDDYKIEYGDRKNTKAGGYAGNQPDSNGYRFNTGGGFYWSDSGGPTVTANVAFPYPWDHVSLSVPLGNKSTSGVFVTVPNTVDRFKLWIDKHYSVQPYNIYQWTYDYNSGFYYWKLISKSHTSTRTGVDYWAKKVN